MQSGPARWAFDRAASKAGTPPACPGGLHLPVAMPALNEEETVGQVSRGIPREIPGGGRIEVVVVDDGSSDRTGERPAAGGAVVIRHPQPRGVGVALVPPVVAAEADFVTASRFKVPELVPEMPWLKLWGNRMMSRLTSPLAGASESRPKRGPVRVRCRLSQSLPPQEAKF